MKKTMSLLVGLSLCACSAYMPQRYNIHSDTNAALKSIDVGNINVGQFSDPAKFDRDCRSALPIAPPDNISFASYIQNAIVAELKAAGKFDDKAPKITLTGEIQKLEFSSIRSVIGGTWDIDLKINSSNGKSMQVSEHYEFDSGFIAFMACKRTAEAYLPAVQNLIEKMVKAPEFKSLVTP